MHSETTLGRARPAPRIRLARLGDMFALARQRRALAKLDASRLRDIGLTRDEALAEACRPIWDVPTYWRR
ncbi:DUF1127 domain-containing protein [Rhodosalinus sp. K401]|uniref:DUF1127 domain-containing protein n=1 Tax=Rhodosalinus sp. K401 TaxID=3239195 RepID=UPI0035244973